MTKAQGILFPSDPFNERTPDTAFGNEVESARWAGLSYSVVLTDSLVNDIPEFRRLPEPESKVFYRGWMLTVPEYTAMFAALESREITMVTTPENYESAHYLPGWVDVFDGITAKTVILPVDADEEMILRRAEELQVSSYFVKDFVKSRKYEWDTACYAPTLAVLPDIVREFVRLQEDYLVGGIVVREFVELDKTQPEVRVWWTHNVPILVTAHPDNPMDEVSAEAIGDFLYEVKERVEQLGSPFVTTDLARKADGSWTVIEVGDGQVSGFPDSITDEQLQRLFSSI
jgi:hypothetical protein